MRERGKERKRVREREQEKEIQKETLSLSLFFLSFFLSLFLSLSLLFTFSHFLPKFSTFSDRPGSQDRASSATLVTTIIINLAVYNHPSPLQAPDQCCPPRAASQRSPQLPTSLQPSILRIFSPTLWATAVFIYNSFILTHLKKEY